MHTMIIHRCCVVCRIIDSSSLEVLTDSQRNNVFLKKGVWISKGSRCCSNHLYKRHLSYESLNQINGLYVDQLVFSIDDVHRMINDFRTLSTTNMSFDFDDPGSLSDESYRNITGLQKGILKTSTKIREILTFRRLLT